MDFSIKEEEYTKFKLRTLEFRMNQMEKKLHDEEVLAKVHTGKIRGMKRLTMYNKTYYSFEGIPYAMPPVGELRFKAPKPMTSWENIKNCTSYGPKAMQRNFMQPKSIEGSEDCLFVNVYTNNLHPTKPRPVLFFIHGGGFIFGEGNREWYGPDYFVEKDVVLITVQYRVAALGFLRLNDPSLDTPGNAGLKDIVLALRWVQKNAANFGGNPECVTVFGESAGATAAHFLLMSEQARGLFHRCILQSGVSNADWCVSSNRSFELAKHAGYKGENKDKEILTFLQSITAEEILDAEIKCNENKGRETFPFMPCVEPYLTDHTVLDKPVEEMFAHSWSNAIPIIFGGTSMEGLFFQKVAANAKECILQSLETCVAYLPYKAALRTDTPEALKKGLLLRKHFVKGEFVLDDFANLISYSFFWHPIHQAIEARLKYASKTPTYLYRYDFESEKLINPFNLVRETKGGVSHTDELSFLFSNVLAKPLERQSREYQCLKRMIALWTQFAETGNPNGASIFDDGLKWHSLKHRSEKDNAADGTDDALKCLNISDKLTFIDLPEMENLKVWKSLYNDAAGESGKTAKITNGGVNVK